MKLLTIMLVIKLSAVYLPLTIIILTAIAIRRLTERNARILKITLFALMVLSGIIKQLYALLTEYDVWYLPLHFSSTFYLSIGFSVFGKNKIARLGSTILFIGGFIMFFMILINPIAVLGNLSSIFASPISFHGYFYHMLVIFQFFIMLFRNDYTPKKHDAVLFTSFTLLWGTIAIPAAFNLHANYMGILKSYIPFLEFLRVTFGYPIYFFTYFLCVFILASLLVFIFFRMRNKTE